MRRMLWLLALPLAVWAQLDDNTVTVTASRVLPALQPDQAVFNINVDAPPDATLDDVLAAVSGAGVTVANLSGVQPGYSYLGESLTMWNFTLTTPVSQVAKTLATLKAADAASPIPMYYNLLYTSVSPQAQASQQCPYALLVSDAQSQAQKLGAAAGAALGPIVWVSDGSTIGPAIPTAAIRQGDFSALLSATAPTTGVIGFPSQVLSTPILGVPPTGCSMTVQFNLQH